jgi:hypothetical protein
MTRTVDLKDTEGLQVDEVEDVAGDRNLARNLDIELLKPLKSCLLRPG